MKTNSTPNMVASYLNVRFAIGVLAVSLPFLLLLICLIYSIQIQESVSAFYYVPQARNWFVAILCCVGIFLLCYRGYPVGPKIPILHKLSETLLHRIMGFSAIAVGMLPTTHPYCKTEKGCPPNWNWIDTSAATLHVFFAVLLFSSMAVVAYFYFPNLQFKTQNLKQRTQERNGHIYRACGMVIFFVGIVWGILRIVNIETLTLFWVELLCVIAFGFAWLVKSHLSLKQFLSSITPSP